MDLVQGGEKVRGVNLGGWLVIEGWIKPSLFDGIPNGDMLVSFAYPNCAASSLGILFQFRDDRYG